MKLLDDEPGRSPSLMAEVIWFKLPLQRQFRPSSFRSEGVDITFLRNVCNILQYYMLLEPTRLKLEMSSFLLQKNVPERSCGNWDSALENLMRLTNRVATIQKYCYQTMNVMLVWPCIVDTIIWTTNWMQQWQFIDNFNQLNMFRAIISFILRSTRLCLQLVV